MRIQIGTRVKFLNDVGGGVVTGFAEDKLALVESDDGFEMPVLVTDLLIDTSAAYGMGEEIETRIEPEPVNEASKEAQAEISFDEKKHKVFKGECLLAIVPQNDQLLHVSNFDLYLINDSNYSLHYCISFKDSAVSSLIAAGIIEPDTKLAIEEFSQTNITKIKEFQLQGVYFKHGLFDVHDPVNLKFSIDGISFYKQNSFIENDYFHQKSILSKQSKEDMQKAVDKLKDSDFAKVVEAKERTEEKKQHKSPVNDSLEEVDLHIEEIIDNHAGMSNGEMLNTQMARFETALETALRSKTQRIVFIHGVGNGRLKHELRKKLERKYGHLKFQDASFKEYGYGATMVYLK